MFLLSVFFSLRFPFCSWTQIPNQVSRDRCKLTSLSLLPPSGSPCPRGPHPAFRLFPLGFPPSWGSYSFSTVHALRLEISSWFRTLGAQGCAGPLEMLEVLLVPVSLCVVTIYCIFYFFCYSFANLSEGPKVWHNYFSLHYLFMMLLSLSFIHLGL